MLLNRRSFEGLNKEQNDLCTHESGMSIYGYVLLVQLYLLYLFSVYL